MSDTDQNKEFFKMSDAYIGLANEQSKSANQGSVSAAFLYAAARFNIFLVAAGSNSAEEFSARKEEAMNYFTAEYKNMLEEHFKDYSDNFEKYIKESL